MVPAMPLETLYFVQISDTHIGPSRSYRRAGYASWPCTQRVVEIINSMPVRPDFVIHTGDVVTQPHPASYALAAATLGQLTVPTYYVTGNHDTAFDIQRCLPMGPRQPATPDPNVLSYAFDIKGYRCLVLEARGPDEIDPHGVLAEAQLEWVAREVAGDGPPLVIFTHFPALPLNSPWMDANMPILNGEDLHRLLVGARTRVRGVFYGHVHQSMQIVRDGVVYWGVASTFSQFTASSVDDALSFDPDYPPGFNFVTLLPQQTIVRQHAFRCSGGT